MKIPDHATIEGLRHARNLVTKQWQKEKQRAEDLRKLADERAEEIKELKRRLNFMEHRYLGMPLEEPDGNPGNRTPG